MYRLFVNMSLKLLFSLLVAALRARAVVVPLAERRVGQNIGDALTPPLEMMVE